MSYVHSVEGAITVGALGQFFRSFLLKLNMIEAQLGQLGPLGVEGGKETEEYDALMNVTDIFQDLSFAVLLELQEEMAPVVSEGQVRSQSPRLTSS